MKKFENKGLYETANVVWKSDSCGKYHLSFNDTFIYADDESHTVEREVQIEGSRFRVHSVFPIGTQSTPVDKILKIIDTDLASEINKSC